MATDIFVEQLYNRLLGRNADVDGSDYWLEQLEGGELNAAEATQAFVQSEEYQAVVAPIARLYFTAFGRIPDADGLAYWTAEAQAGRSLQDIGVSILESDEYQSLYGSDLDDVAFLEQLYLTSFSREPNVDDSAYWLTALSDNSLSRADVLAAFASSQELQAAKNIDIDVIAQYHGILSRAPTQTEIDSVIGSGDDTVSQITRLYANDQYSGETVPGLSQAGVVVDGYVSGASVTMTKSDGTVVSVITDENGNFDFGADAGFGTLVMTGGTDISTGKPFEGRMTAPAGATVVNPITTLIDQYLDVLYGGGGVSQRQIKNARKDVLETLGLKKSVDALTYDPMKEASRTDTTTDATEQALSFQAAATQINTLVTQVGALLEGAGAAIDESAGNDAAVEALADLVVAGTIDLASTNTIKQVTTAAAGKAGADSSSQARIDSMADDAAQTVANLNQAIQDAVDSAGVNHTGALQEIAQVQVVAENVEDELESGAANDDLSEARASTEGTRFTDAVDAEKDNVSVVDGVGAVYQPPAPPPPPRDTTAPTATLSYSTDTGLIDGTGAEATLAVKQGDTLRIFARFNESIVDASGASITINDGTNDLILDGVMVKASSTLYYYDLSVPVGDFTGTVTITAAADAAGNVIGAAPTNATFAVDNTAPSTTLSGLSLSDDTGIDGSDGVTKTATQTLNATLSQALVSGEIVVGSVDGGTNWTDITDKVSDTAVVWDTMSLIDGSNQIQLKVTDAAGNDSGTSTLDYVLDTDAPTIAILVVSNDDVVNSSDTLTAVAFSGTTTGIEDGQGVTVDIAGMSVTATVTGNSFSGTINLSGVADGGSLSVMADVSDLAGNAATQFSNTLTKDSSVPVISNVAFVPASGTLKIGDSLTAIITADETGYSAGSITINGKAVTGFTDNNDNTYSVTYTVAEGDTDISDSAQIPLSVVLNDAAGNSSGAYTTSPAAGNAPAVDANAPTIATLVVSSDDRVNESDTLTAVTFSGTTTGVEDGQQVTVNIAGASATATVTGNSYSGTINLSGVSDGASVALTADVSDQAGNAASQFSHTVEKDSVAPVISSVVFTPSSGVLKSGSTLTATIHADGTGYSAGAITINGKTVTGFTDNNDNTYSVTYTVADGDTDIADSAQIPVSVVLTDAAGNSNSAFTTAPSASDAPAVDASTPTNAFTDASYDAASNTLTLTGTNIDTLLSLGEDSTTDLKANFDWTKLRWDIDSTGSSYVDFTDADIDSVKATDASTLTITFASTIDTKLEAVTGFDAFDTDDTIEISAGFSADSAGNTATTDAYDGPIVENTVVFFDIPALTSTSSQTDEEFKSGVTYDIYILVEHFAATGGYSSNPSPAGFEWSGGENLGTDDTIYLVSTGDGVHGKNGNRVDQIVHDPSYAPNATVPRYVEFQSTSLGVKVNKVGMLSHWAFDSFSAEDLWDADSDGDGAPDNNGGWGAAPQHAFASSIPGYNLPDYNYTRPVDSTPPTLNSSTPADDAQDVALDSDIVLTFDEDIALGAGNIVISDGSDTITIDVTNHSNQLSINGSELTINPSSDLANSGASYNVQIDSGAITDTAGNAYAGINDSTTLNFDTDPGFVGDPSVVVFDMTRGVSSSHDDDRNFKADVTYTIYIVTDSDGKGSQLPQEHQWKGGSNLGSDDTVYLVGDGATIKGGALNENIDVVTPYFNPVANIDVRWGTNFETHYGARLMKFGGFFRYYTQYSQEGGDLWTGTWTAYPQVPNAITTLNSNIWTTQGLQPLA